MASITLKGCDPFDGSYDLAVGEEPFTTGDLNIIKTISGVRAGEIQDAFAAGDTDLIVALAVVALHRAGKIVRRQAYQVAERLWDAPAGALTFDAGETEDGDARPPEPQPSVAPSE